MIIGGHDPTGAGEEIRNAIQGFPVELHVPSEIGGNRLLGEIVVGRTQTSAEDHKIGGRTAVPLKGIRQSHTEPLVVVPHHGLVVDGDPQRSQSLGEKGGVGIDDIPQKQLGSYAKNLGCPNGGGGMTGRRMHNHDLPKGFLSSKSGVCFKKAK